MVDFEMYSVFMSLREGNFFCVVEQVVLVDPGSFKAKSNRGGTKKVQEGAAVVDFQGSKSVIRAIQGQVPRWSRLSGSEDHAGLLSFSVPFSVGDCEVTFLKGVRGHTSFGAGLQHPGRDHEWGLCI
jgi:hypothetical protein